ncbi:MAG TPA: hypothetical protein VFQ77_15775 [Pseudonocardiaceae bacterium]|jgi:hypothetical protein|nr:hypothetical protein [Pseudonocardiaceae bacterium]
MTGSLGPWQAPPHASCSTPWRRVPLMVVGVLGGLRGAALLMYRDRRAMRARGSTP